MYSLNRKVVTALVSHAPISALKEYALRNTDRSSSSSSSSSMVVVKCTTVIVGFEPSVSIVTYQTSFFMLLQIEYYTNVLTQSQSSNSTGVPRPDIGVERVRTSKH